MNNEWLDGLKEKLKDYDVFTLIDLLGIETKDIIEMFEYDIEDKAEDIAEGIGYDIE